MPPFPAQPPAKGAVPRRVANLAFPEILVIWALRHYANCRQALATRTAAIAPGFSRAFGLAQLEESLAAFAVLAESLSSAARLPQALSAVEDDRINASEEAVLAALAAFQRGEVARAHALSEWCLLPGGRQCFIEGAKHLAQAMRKAGHLIPYEAPRRRELALNQQGADGMPASANG